MPQLENHSPLDRTSVRRRSSSGKENLFSHVNAKPRFYSSVVLQGKANIYGNEIQRFRYGSGTGFLFFYYGKYLVLATVFPNKHDGDWAQFVREREREMAY